MPARGSARLALLCLAILLVGLPLTLQRPGLPFGLKADEPAYYLMARSLWEDHDLQCESRDLLRASDDFLGNTQDLILLTRDHWQTTYFGKPYFGSLLAAPLVAAFGPGGYFALNAFLLVLAIAMGWVFLRRDNDVGEALLFSVGYFLVSASWIYVFWLQPEILSLCSTMACLFFSLHDFEAAAAAAPASPLRRLLARIFNPRTQWLWAGLAIGPAVNFKPFHLLAVLPGTITCLGRRRLGALLLFAAATLVSTGAIAMGQKQLTGTWTPYFGNLRRSFNVTNPTSPPWYPLRESLGASQAAAASGTDVPPPVTGPAVLDNSAGGRGSWSWILHLPEVRGDKIGRDMRNFFIGRHTGALIYFPFLGVALLLFVSGGGARDPARWGALAALAGLFAFSIFWHHSNYHGGAGFVGNRYLVGVYPAGLFLVRRLRPRLFIVLGFVLGAVFVGQIVFAPLGLPVPEPTLQAYARARPLQWLPFEYPQWAKIPGYRGLTQGDAYLHARRDRVHGSGEWVDVIGRGETEIFVARRTPAKDVAILVRNFAPGNVVDVALGRERRTLRFPDTPPPPGGASELVVLPYGPPLERFGEFAESVPDLVWSLRVTPHKAAQPGWYGQANKTLLGARFVMLGESVLLTRNVYGVEWVAVAAPAEAPAGEGIELQVTVRNTSAEPWIGDQPVRVKFAGRWLDAAGAPAAGTSDLPEVPRAELPGPVSPGETTSFMMAAHAPGKPGDYQFEIEPVYEYARWFGEVDPAFRRRLPLRVLPALAP